MKYKNFSFIIFISFIFIFNSNLISAERLQVIFSDTDFKFVQQVADAYKSLPADVQEKLKPVLLSLADGLNKGVTAGIFKKEDADRIIAMFKLNAKGPNAAILAAQNCDWNLLDIRDAARKTHLNLTEVPIVWAKIAEQMPGQKIPQCPSSGTPKSYVIVNGKSNAPCVKCTMHGMSYQINENSKAKGEERVQVVLNEQDFAKIRILADWYQKLPAEAKEKLKPTLACIKGALLKAAEAGVLKSADVDKIIAMFAGKGSDETDRLQVILEQKDFDFLQKVASLYILMPDETKAKLKPYLEKAKDALLKAAAANILKKEDVDKILQMFNLKTGGNHPVAEWLVSLINRIVAIFDQQKELVAKGGTEQAQIDALLSEAEDGVNEMVSRLQILLDQKDWDALQKAAAAYTLLPDDIKKKIQPVMEQVKQALLSAAKAGVLKQDDVNKILQMFKI
ncbi:MAG: hypothetical protein PHW04_18240 [Candidatus Wallbacteria bacterium]|nr:hypothetical protein [Candidatus Wallbacteria bacterium]